MYLCEKDPNIYEIYTPNQGIVYLIVDGIYIMFEIFYIVKFVRICRKKPSIKYDLGLVLFYVCIHLVCIRGIMYFLGGVLICYNEYFYDLLSTLYYGFKQAVILLFTYRITLLLQYYNVFPRNTVLKNCCIALFIINEAGTISFYLYDLKHDNLVPLAVFTAIINSIIFMGFFIIAFILRNTLSKATRGYKRNKLILDWCAVMVTLAGSVFINLLEAIYRIYEEFVLSPKVSEKVSHTTEYAITMGIYYLFTEIVPFYIMIWIFSQDEEEEERIDV